MTLARMTKQKLRRYFRQLRTQISDIGHAESTQILCEFTLRCNRPQPINQNALAALPAFRALELALRCLCLDQRPDRRLGYQGESNWSDRGKSFDRCLSSRADRHRAQFRKTS